MATSRSEFKIHIPTTFDPSGVDQAKASYAALSAQLKVLQADIANAERTGVAVPDDAKAKVESLTKAIAGLGGAEESGAVTHRELHEGIRLVALSAGDALGPIGELAHFLSNPYLLAASGATLAIKMLVDQHVKMREELEKNIRATIELRDTLRNNLGAAVEHVAESLASFHEQMAQAGRVQNEFADQLQQQTAQINQQATAAHSLAQARQQLYSANIEGARLSGEITGPQAAAFEEHNRRQTRTDEEHAEHEQHAREIDEQRRDAENAMSAARKAQAQAESPERTAQRVSNQAAVSSAQDSLKDAEDAAKKSLDEITKTKAQVELAGVSPSDAEKSLDPTEHAAIVAKIKAQATAKGEAESQAAHAAGATGITQSDFIQQEVDKQLEALKKFEDAAKKHDEAIGSIDRARHHLAEVTIKAQDFEDETKRLEDRAVTLKNFAETTAHAAAAQERLNAATEAAHAAVDATQDQAARQRRMNYLMGRAQSGQMTPDEQAEAGGAFATTPQATINETRLRIGQIEYDIRRQGGHATAAEFGELKELMDRLIGVTQNIYLTAPQGNTIESLREKVEALERAFSDHNSRTTLAPYQ